MTTASTRARVVSLDADGLVIDGAFTPLVTGSLEYWRINSLHWRKCLGEMRKAGIHQIACFVCWDHHQLEDGTLDFEGRTHPSRNLAGFIDCCAEEGFDYLIRLGPIIDAEWPTRGPIDEVCRLERIDPLYRQRVEEYLNSVLDIVVPRLATRGGPIILVSPDNEPYFPYSTDAETDPSEGSIHVPYHREQVLEHYRGWLRARYGDDDALQRAWRHDGLTIDGISEPDYKSATREEVIDSFAFITDVIAENYAWMARICRERGVDVPIYSNMKQFSEYIDWGQIEGVVDAHGLGMFFSNLLPGDQALVASWYVRVQRAVTRFPWAAEFQSVAPMGLDDVFGSLDDRHHRYITEFALALGLRGLSYYVFVERDDCQYAPISPTGKVRPRMTELVRAIDLAQQVRPDRHLRDVALLWSLDHHRLAVADRFDSWEKLYHLWIDMDLPKELSAWWAAFRELHEKDYDFEVVPIASTTTAKVLLYAGPGVVRPTEWEAVVDRVEGGATLVTAQLPERALFGSDDDVVRLNERLEATGRVIRPRQDEQLSEVLARAGGGYYVRSGHPDVWTFVYAAITGYQFFAINVGDQERSSSFELAEQFAAKLVGLEAREFGTERTWRVGGQTLLPDRMTLAPTECFVVSIGDGYGG